MKGYRSDYDLLIIVNDRRLTHFASYWYKAADRLLHDRGVTTQVGFIVHSRREVNTALRKGQYFFSDIRREGIALYELDDEPLAEPRPLTPADEYKVAKQHFGITFAEAQLMLKIAQWQCEQSQANSAWRNGAAFNLHQAIEHAYSTALLTLTNYGPPSHNLNFLRTLTEGRDRRLSEAWPRDQQRFRAWFNTINEAYVKARYSKHFEISEFEISEEALVWLGERTKILHRLVETICKEHLEQLQNATLRDVFSVHCMKPHQTRDTALDAVSARVPEAHIGPPSSRGKP
ncbi:nucleotidyltransferase [Phyllobacterium zundukense]|uniref:nucleotidyltransferase n=1 Tax=Phyllobacterium zundukense TaxID=1867719 RepID=UPI003965A17B